MATDATRQSALRLYKQVLRNSTKFVTYNYRAYAWRHTKYTFRENQDISSNEEIMNCLEKGTQELESLKRQIIVDRLYSTNNSIHRLPIFKEAVQQAKHK
eukprot:44569_1